VITSKKLHLYLLILVALTLLFSFYIVSYSSGWLSDSSKDLTALREELLGLERKQLDLEIAKKTLKENGSVVDNLKLVLPSEKEQARVVQEIESIADTANVTISSVGFPSSTLGSAAVSAPKPQNSEPQAEVKPATTPETVSQAEPIKEIPGVQSINITIGTISSKDPSIKGVRYDEMMSLIRLFERNRRTMQIQSIDIGQNPNSSDGPATYTLSLSMLIFIQP
jgi:hypothetical protein